MNERELRNLIAKVKDGRLSRRTFVRSMVALGLTAPMAGMMLSQSGVAMAEPSITYKPPKAGGGGPLKLLLWQAPTLLNPHFAVGTKDQEACRLFYEPLAGWDKDGNLVPILAAEIPGKENDGLAEDGLSVVWKLKRGVKWHDGAPFTADDVVFNWEYAKNPETAAVSIGSYKDIKLVEKVDDHTVRVTFAQPTPFWADAFVASYGMIIPKHLFADYAGSKSRDAPTNLKPVGTGPYLFSDFKPGDSVSGKRNPDYHQAGRPYFDTVEIKGGGDAVSAARAVLQTGEYDYGWNMQVEDEILLKLENGGQGRISIVPTGNIEYIALNVTDPNVEVDGERASIKTRHPLFSDPAVREAINLLIDRASVQKFIYGRAGIATANFLNNPERFRSKNTKFEFNIEKANQILEAAGWKKGSDGIRAKDGKQLKFAFQTSINSPRQKNQAIVKQACRKAGIDVELKSIVASVFFSSDTANPDTYSHFYCDAQMYQTTMPQADPQFFMNQFTSWEVATKENKWQGRNISRWQNKEYDDLFRQAQSELDPVKRAAIFIKMNDLVVGDHYILPEINRPRPTALKNGMVVHESGWDNDLWQIANWYREA
ncbi:peptide ABC transporter substrate-binding protein [Bradyrhizobium sp. ARR65]|uniref:peptide ABC transporter substrate-binding protein n=1 Tax=Bradyrhizobium sp. ARR65 TaxID=1040989 RepID=UPI0004651E9B|nr:peptide ABC transporter substrate-binding protein [Bradyrhizobium sp. ARR65]